MPRAENAGTRAHQSSWLLLVRAVSQLRRIRAMRKLQHFHDPSQAAQPPRMSLLLLVEADTEAVPEMPIEIRLFLWRRFGTFGRASPQGISRCAHSPARPRYRTYQAAISGNAWCLRE